MIYPIFDSIPDHRVTGRCIYKLGDLLVIALLTMMCGGEDYVDMSEFAALRVRDFGLLSDCGDNSPSPDTFERLMSAVDPDELERCLIEHGPPLRYRPSWKKHNPPTTNVFWGSPPSL